MDEQDQHFWIKDVINRLPNGLVPRNQTWSATLTAVAQLKTERNNAILRVQELERAVGVLAGSNSNWPINVSSNDELLIDKLLRSIDEG